MELPDQNIIHVLLRPGTKMKPPINVRAVFTVSDMPGVWSLELVCRSDSYEDIVDELRKQTQHQLESGRTVNLVFADCGAADSEQSAQ